MYSRLYDNEEKLYKKYYLNIMGLFISDKY
jgi:hypothetical protein